MNISKDIKNQSAMPDIKVDATKSLYITMMMIIMMVMVMMIFFKIKITIIIIFQFDGCFSGEYITIL